MYYPSDLVEEVRRNNDIVDVISSYVKLKKSGSNYFGLCPFHNEKSGSFSVSPSRQMYKCFGCGKGGSVITFIMEYENYNFPEAVQFLADRAGIKMPEIEYSKEERQKDNLKARILEVNKEAGKFYYYQLRKEAGVTGLNYLTGRGLSDESIQKFGLGYAVTGRNLLYQYLKSKGFDDEVLNKSGIFVYDEQHGMMDKFWNRVIFPIMDINHRIIGFGGRVMGDGKPKYLNSPETPVFDKGRNLYGLNHARTSRKNNMIICEGYMDVIALHQAGFNQAVASLGTAFTGAHGSLLKRYTENVLLTYDSDDAGVKAALRAIPMLRQAGLSVKVINLTPYKDPDEFIKALGPEEFQKRIDDAENAFYYEARIREREFDLKDPDGVTRFNNELAKMLLRFEDAIERDNYLDGICKKYKINPENMQAHIRKLVVKGEGIKEYEKPRSTVFSKQLPENSIKKTQKLLLTWLLDEPFIYDTLKKYLQADDFTEDIYRTVATLLFEQIENNSINPAGIISSFTNEDEQNEVASLFSTNLEKIETDSEKEQAIKDILIKVKTYSYELHNKQSDPTDMAALSALIDEKKKLKELKNIKISFTGK